MTDASTVFDWEDVSSYILLNECWTDIQRASLLADRDSMLESYLIYPTTDIAWRKGLLYQRVSVRVVFREARKLKGDRFMIRETTFEHIWLPIKEV